MARLSPAHIVQTIRERRSPAALVLVSSLLLLVSKILRPILEGNSSASVGIVILPILVFLFPSAIYIRMQKEGYLQNLLLKPGKAEALLLPLLSAMLLISGGLLLSILTSGVRHLPGVFTLYETFEAPTTGSAENTVYLLIAYALLPAIAEELLFRGILRYEYEKFGGLAAILMTSLLFSVIHFNLMGLPVYLFSGVVLATTAYLCRSVFAAVIAHFLYNVFGLFGQPYISSFYQISGSKVLFTFVLIFALLLSLALFCGEAARLSTLYAGRNLPCIIPEVKEQSFKRTAGTLLLAPDTVLCVLLWIVISVVSLFL